MSDKTSLAEGNDPEAYEVNDGLSNSFFFIGAVTLLSLLMLFVWQICSTYLLAYDAGLIAIGSDLILRGGHIYRDLHTVMFPGSYFILFFVFSIFGSTQVICNITASSTILGVGVLLLLISRNFLKDYSVYLPAGMVMIFGSFTCPFVNHHWDSLFWLLAFCLGLFLLVKRLDSSKAKLFLIGILGGVSICCYQNQALPVVAGLASLLLFYLNSQVEKKEALLRILAVIFGIGVVFGSLLLYLILTDSLAAMYDSTVKFVLERYESVNQVEYGWSNFESTLVGDIDSSFAFFAALPYGVLKLAPILVLGGIIFFRIKFGRFVEILKTKPQVFLLFVLAISLFISELHKPDLKRLVFGEPLLFVCLFFLANQVKYKSARILISIFYMGLAMGMVVNIQSIRKTFLSEPEQYQTRRGQVSSTINLKVVEKLDSMASDYEKVLIYPYDTGMSYLTKTTFPGKFPTLQYRYHSAENFKSVIEDMEKSEVRFVVLNRAMNNQNFSISGFPTYEKMPGQDLIIEPYLKLKYRPVGTYGFYTLFQRN